MILCLLVNSLSSHCFLYFITVKQMLILWEFFYHYWLMTNFMTHKILFHYVTPFDCFLPLLTWSGLVHFKNMDTKFYPGSSCNHKSFGRNLPINVQVTRRFSYVDLMVDFPCNRDSFSSYIDPTLWSEMGRSNYTYYMERVELF